ncbi:hypothetical protein L208DRAFT_1292223 [Tricholoma matsutake]|nr:hypothetical protein L208DRAFT_1292223 [Tricholoma matsutake 945]
MCSSLSSLSGHGVGGVGPTQTQRNPLTLDKWQSFSWQLLNIAFVLYWREDGGNANGGMGVMARLAGVSADGGGGMVRCMWEGV